MHITVVGVFYTFIFLTGKSNKAFLVDEDAHRVTHTRYKYIDAEIEFMTLPQRRFRKIFLDHERIFDFFTLFSSSILLCHLNLLALSCVLTVLLLIFQTFVFLEPVESVVLPPLEFGV